MRQRTRLESDDNGYCKWCGCQLPKIMIDGPIAGAGTEYKAVELCGACKADELLYGMARGEL